MNRTHLHHLLHLIPGYSLVYATLAFLGSLS